MLHCLTKKNETAPEDVHEHTLFSWSTSQIHIALSLTTFMDGGVLLKFLVPSFCKILQIKYLQMWQLPNDALYFAIEFPIKVV